MASWIFREDIIKKNNNFIHYFFPYTEYHKAEAMNVGDRVFYCNNFELLHTCKIKSIHIKAGVFVSLEILNHYSCIKLSDLRKVWGLKNLDIFKIPEISFLLLKSEEEMLLHSLCETPDLLHFKTQHEHIDNYFFLFRNLNGLYFQDRSIVQKRYQFFQRFSRKEWIETMSWEQFKEIGEHLYAFRFPMVKDRALSKLRMPIQHYRDSFMHLVYGEQALSDRINDFYSNPKYRLFGFGPNAIGEIIHNVFPDYFCLLTTKECMVLDNILNEQEPIRRDSKLGDRIQSYQSLISSSNLINRYIEIVGKQTDLPVHYELSRFLRYLYDDHIFTEEEEYHNSEIADVQYWIYSLQKGEDKEVLFNDSIITLPHKKLGDLKEYKSRKDMAQKYKEIYKLKRYPYLKAAALYQFCYEMKEGDYVFIRRENNQFLGLGKITSDYMYEGGISYRKIEWITVGKWKIEGTLHYKSSITNITPFEDTLTYLLDLLSDI
jgi:hypothetical protein